MVIIEIARDNYQHAFEVLGPDVLEDAFFLYVDAEVERCIKRINERTLHPTSSDDHYVPDHILRTYYEKDDGSDIGRYLMQAYGVPDGRIMMARNNGTHSEFTAQITTITETILTKLSAWNAA